MGYKTIKVYLAAIRHSHLLQGLPDPTGDPLLHYTLKGIRRSQGDSSRTRLPITVPILKQLKSHLHASVNISVRDKRMLWAAFCTAFYGFLRSAEFTCPTSNSFDPEQTMLLSDVQAQGHFYLIRVKSSKTDPFRRGVTVTLAPTFSSTCPISALSKYLSLLPTSNPEVPLFQFADGRYLTRSKLTECIRELLAASGHSPMLYASHSFRIGAATSAAAAGIPDWLIQTLGRWSSQCFQVYIHTPKHLIQSSFQRIAASH